MISNKEIYFHVKIYALFIRCFRFAFGLSRPVKLVVHGLPFKLTGLEREGYSKLKHVICIRKTFAICT